MLMIARVLSIVMLLCGLAVAQAQQFGSAEFAIKDDDGDPIANHSLTAEQMAKLARLPGLVDVGDAIDDVTLYEFYDLNCPFCREAAADVDQLIRTDRALRVVFVPYPVLSAASVEGARVELAGRELASPTKFLEFPRKIYAGRGIIDGARALAVTREMSLDQNKIIEIANAQRVTDTMTKHAKVGAALKLVATPAYVIQGVAILGHPGLEPLRKVIAAVRTCKKVVC
jgi:protein-disulfide isomerase